MVQIIDNKINEELKELIFAIEDINRRNLVTKDQFEDEDIKSLLSLQAFMNSTQEKIPTEAISIGSNLVNIISRLINDINPELLNRFKHFLEYRNSLHQYKVYEINQLVAILLNILGIKSEDEDRLFISGLKSIVNLNDDDLKVLIGLRSRIPFYKRAMHLHIMGKIFELAQKSNPPINSSTFNVFVGISGVLTNEATQFLDEVIFLNTSHPKIIET